MSEKDDQDWLQSLGGAEAKDADVNTLREARALRAAMLEYARKDETPEFDREAGLQRLLFRLRREKLVEGAKPRWQMPFAFAIAATLALAIGVGVFIGHERGDDELTKTRGLVTAQWIDAADPKATREALVRELTALGAQPRVRDEQGVLVLEVAWPPQADEAHAAFLERHKLRAPDGYVLEIRIRAK